MEHSNNAVLIQSATLQDIERMINLAVDARMEAFYNSLQRKAPVLIERKEAARRIGRSLPTLDKYGKYGILHPKHIGGRVYYDEEELKSILHPR